jgi:hypothetical protein
MAAAWVRRLRDLIEFHLGDLGGVDAVSAAEHSIVRRASTLEVELERLEAKFALAGEADGSISISANLRRLLEAVGLQRRPRNVTPDLDSCLARKRAGESAGAFYGSAGGG